MSFTLTIGWWVLPLLVTIAGQAWALPLRADEQPTGSMFDGMRFFGPIARSGFAVIVSLLAWLVWALAR